MSAPRSHALAERVAAGSLSLTRPPAPRRDDQDEATRVVGKVLERPGGAAIEGAVVRLVGPTKRTSVTDSAGEFLFVGVAPGAYRLSVEHIAYEGISVTIPVEDRTTTSVGIEIPVGAIELEPVEVTVTRRSWVLESVGFYERMDKGIGRFLSKPQLDKRGARLSDVLRGVPGVRVRRAGGRYLVVMRGGCRPVYYVDGQRWESFGQTVDDLAASANVEGVEIYQAAQVPAIYRSGDVPCGVIAFWMRRGG